MHDAIFIKVEPSDINYINRIMEGYEYLGVVTTVNRKDGVLRIRVTPDTLAEVQLVLEKLPISFTYVNS